MDTYKLKVLVTAFLVQACFGGGVFGIPRMTMVIAETFHGTRAQAGAVIATMNAVRNCIGVFCGTFVHKYGSKYAGVLGSVLMALGYCASFFAKSIGFLVASIGIFSGTGLAFIYISCPTVICDAFEKKHQYLALTIMNFGSSVGGMMFSFSIGYALDIYGVRGTCLILGGVVLNGIAFSTQWVDKSNERHKNDIPTSTSNATNHQVPANKSQFYILKHVIMVKPFSLAAFGLSVCIASSLNAYIYLVDTFGNTDQGSRAMYFTPVLFSCFSLIGRLLSGSLKHFVSWSTLDMPLLATVAGIIGSLLIAFGDSVAVKVVGWCLNGMAIGVFLISMQLVAVSLLERHYVAHGIGVMLTLDGIGLLLGGPFNGFIRDTLGSYMAVFIFTAVSVFVGGMSVLAAKILRAVQIAVVI